MSVQQKKEMKKFPIGFWNYVPIEQLDVSCVRDWKDAGMTLAMSPELGPEPEQVSRMRTILDKAQEQDIQVILCDQRTYWRSLMKEGEEEYRRSFKQALNDFGNHPAVFGFNVGDEPGKEDFPSVYKAIRIQKKMAPHLSPFCNLLAWSADNTGPRVGYDLYTSYLDAYVAGARPDFLCYDYYSQMKPGTWGINKYFEHLREYHEAGKRHGIPFWVTLLSVGHWNYRCPKEDDFRWQLNTAIAHGAKGLLWFFFYMRYPHDNARISPIDEHWERTETFQWLSRINRTFLKSTAAIVKDLALQKVSHVGKAWGGFPLFDGSGLVSKIQSLNETPLIVSEFRHSNENDYVMVVNNSQTDNTRADLWIKGRKPRLYHVGWRGEESQVVDDQGNDCAMIQQWLAPGQMELWRLKPGQTVITAAY